MSLEILGLSVGRRIDARAEVDFYWFLFENLCASRLRSNVAKSLVYALRSKWPESCWDLSSHVPLENPEFVPLIDVFDERA